MFNLVCIMIDCALAFDPLIDTSMLMIHLLSWKQCFAEKFFSRRCITSRDWVYLVFSGNV